MALGAAESLEALGSQPPTRTSALGREASNIRGLNAALLLGPDRRLKTVARFYVARRLTRSTAVPSIAAPPFVTQ